MRRDTPSMGSLVPVLLLLLALALTILTSPRGSAQEPPPLVVTWPWDHAVTNNTTLPVTGTTRPGANVTVTVVDQFNRTAYTTVARADGRFCVTVRLLAVIQSVNVTASDSNGTSPVVCLTVTCDTDPPRFVVTDPPFSPFPTNRTRFRVKFLNTGSPNVRIYVNGIDTAGSGGMWIDLVEGPNDVVVRAVDPAGNEAVERIVLVLDTVPPSLLTVMGKAQEVHTSETTYLLWGEVRGASSVTVECWHSANGATIQPGSGSDPDLWTCPLSLGPEDGTVRVFVKASDPAGNCLEGAILVTLDRTPPLLVIQYNGTTREPWAIINGQTEEWITTVSAGGRDHPVVDGHFRAQMSLKHGWNYIGFQVFDRARNCATQRADVFCSLRPPHIELPEHVWPEGDSVHLRGLTDVYIDHIMVGTTYVPVKDGQFDVVINLTSGQDEVVLRAEDPAGAATVMHVQIGGGPWNMDWFWVAPVTLVVSLAVVVALTIHLRSRRRPGE